MHTTTSVKHRMHRLHEGGTNLLHQTGYLLHQKDFWYFFAIVAAITAVFTLLLLLGKDAAVEYQMYPYPVP